MGRTEAKVLWQAAIFFYVIGLVFLYFGGVVTTAVFFCVAIVVNLGAVESASADTARKSEYNLAERLARMEGELKVLRRMLEEEAARSNR